MNTLEEQTYKKYLVGNENINDLWSRVTSIVPEEAVRNRLIGYLRSDWFRPATPIMLNAGKGHGGLPISCFLNEVEDSIESIAEIQNENIFLATGGGGIGTCWSQVRPIGSKVRESMTSSGIIPFLKMQESQSLAISQGLLRRGSAAVYLDINHAEIEEFLDLRRPTGDPNRRMINLNHAVVIDDNFMYRLKDRDPAAVRTWIKLLTARLETGEPYILFKDTVNRLLPDVYKRNNLQVTTSNLCSEITLFTGRDYNNVRRTAVCCLSSINLKYYREFSRHPYFISDVVRFLDCVLDEFIRLSPDTLSAARYSATMERSIGLGVMGLHTLFQQESIDWDTLPARLLNKQIFKWLKESADAVNELHADLYGACPDAVRAGLNVRHANVTAIAPTSNISIVCGQTSPGIEPYAANVFVHKTKEGSYTWRNPLLNLTDAQWSQVIQNKGSVSGIVEGGVFKTAFEINPYSIIDLAGDRVKYIDQAQSLNLFLPTTIDKRDLHGVHFRAWEAGVKSLYYLRSTSLQYAQNISECSSCQ